MSEPTGQPGWEAVSYDLLIPELEGAMHRAMSETVILRARLAARDRELAALRAQPQPLEQAGQPERPGTLAAHREELR